MKISDLFSRILNKTIIGGEFSFQLSKNGNLVKNLHLTVPKNIPDSHIYNSIEIWNNLLDPLADHSNIQYPTGIKMITIGDSYCNIIPSPTLFAGRHTITPFGFRDTLTVIYNQIGKSNILIDNEQTFLMNSPLTKMQLSLDGPNKIEFNYHDITRRNSDDKCNVSKFDVDFTLHLDDQGKRIELESTFNTKITHFLKQESETINQKYVFLLKE